MPSPTLRGLRPFALSRSLRVSTFVPLVISCSRVGQRSIPLLLLVPLAVAAQPAPPAATAPAPLARTALLKELASNPQMKAALAEQITALGGKPEAVLAGTAPARPGEDLQDVWHQGATLTPRDPQLAVDDKPLGLLVLYNAFIHSLKECLAGNYVPIATGPGSSPYAGAGLYDMPGDPKTPHPWIVEVGFELEGLKADQIRLQVNHAPVPSFRLRETSLLSFVNLGGGKHFVELTQPPADPTRRTRKFWYTRVLRL